ncbi:MAG: selenide, water dikinase SelD, partial [Bacillus sp. (in: Bacteria)]|nr:selenide, water dikinase SelD [Bacillus sp. (in: firmicutes)]
GDVTFPKTMDQIDQWILCDAVTSGGLLIAVSGTEANDLLVALQKAGVQAGLIGEVVAENPGHISVL